MKHYENINNDKLSYNNYMILITSPREFVHEISNRVLLHGTY